MSAPMHTCRDGTTLRIRDMTDSHLLNTIRLYRKKCREGLVVMSGGVSICDDEPWADVDELYDDEAAETLNLKAYEREARRRRLHVT